jgi:hypothetical protein
VENTTKLELSEVVGIYERGETVGTHRGVRTGMAIGTLVTLTVAGIVLAVLCATGLLRFAPSPAQDGTTEAPPLLKTGPIGVPSGGPPAPLVPGLPPAPAPDTQATSPTPLSGPRRPVRLPSD